MLGLDALVTPRVWSSTPQQIGRTYVGSDLYSLEDDVDLVLPDWVSELRDHQGDAVDAIVDAFKRVDVVFLDAPTGAGKTLIAEIVRQRMQARAAYVCSSISLQKQFVGDFPYAALLNGRRNYPTQVMDFPEYSAEDCIRDGTGEDAYCPFCPEVLDCAYEVAKREALMADLAVLNTKYFLTVTNHVGQFNDRGLVIVDECDVLESELMSFTEFRISESRLRKLGLTAPKKGSHQKTIAAWLLDELVPAATQAGRRGQLTMAGDELKATKEKKALLSLINEARRIAVELSDDADAVDENGEPAPKNWLRDNDAGPLVLKPIQVSKYGKFLWPHGKKWLLMSATIISSDEMADSLGLDTTYETVTMPMTFPKENRETIVAGVANMANRFKEDEWPKMAHGLEAVLDRHPNDRVLVHCVSYKLTEYLVGELGGLERPVIRYTGTADRERALSDLRRSDNGVLLAPSFERGIDLRDDDCRVVIVAKVPFPNLGDDVVSARLHTRGGQEWYSVQTVRSLVQMTGRAVRSKDDHATMWILDQQFVKNVLKKNKFLLPKWWREALRMDFPMRELVTPNQSERNTSGKQ